MPANASTPSAEEQLLLELVNRLRTAPAGEFDTLIADAATGTGVQADITWALTYFGVDLVALEGQLAGLTAVAPLAWNAALATAAGAHTGLMAETDTQSHRIAGEASLGQRITAAGYDGWTVLYENVYAYAEDMVYGHAGFVIDWGYDDEDVTDGRLNAGWRDSGDGIQDPAGHRLALMTAALTEIGIAALAEADAATDVGPWLITQDMGTRSDYAAQLLGVVIDDQDGDQFYDIGEGLGGVTVTATGTAGIFVTETWDAGGYQMVLPAGSYTVTFSGGGLDGVIQASVTLGEENVKLDARADETAIARDLTGTAADEALWGGTGNDVLRGLGGNDSLYGGDGADTLEGGAGDDFLFGGASAADLRDLIYGGDGNDRAEGGSGNDALNGGAGHDTLSGGLGSDTLAGNSGNDLLSGMGGADLIYGNGGNDTLNGGYGYDRLNGGDGADLFFHQGVAGHGSDWVQDYDAAEGDLLATGLAGATAGQFQVNLATTPGAGAAEVAEAFVVYRPTGQILFALVDGAGQAGINLQIGAQVFDILI